jgi:hypothetical protein
MTAYIPFVGRTMLGTTATVLDRVNGSDGVATRLVRTTRRSDERLSCEPVVTLSKNTAKCSGR